MNWRETWAVAQRGRDQLRFLPLRRRLKMISALKRVILRDRKRILDEVQKETGKCRTDVLMSELFSVLDHLDYLEKNAAKILQDREVKTPLALMGKKSKVYFEPMGIVLVISPWNYPFYQAIVPITSSFIAGNATLYKPSEHTPLRGLVESLLLRAGFHKDWVQVLYGDGKTAAEAISCRPDKIFFTGSVKTGKSIMSQASQQLIPVELELGGKDPMIVFEDIDIPRAVSGAIWGAFTNAGQSCTSVELLFVHQNIYEAFKKELLQQIAEMKIGVDRDGDSDMGRMTVGFQLEVVKSHVIDALSQGAHQLTGQEWDGRSDLVPPIVLEGVTPSMRVFTEETFGPVLPLIRFREIEEIVKVLNQSAYGLSASVWSADLKRADQVARMLQTGNVSINNVMLTEGNHALPFGGVKNSGFGRYKGEFGLYSFSNIKSILVDKNSSKKEVNWYPYTALKFRLFENMMVHLYYGGILSLIRFIFSGLKLEKYNAKAKR